MNIKITHAALVTTTLACALLAACSTPPSKPEGAASARNRLMQLQADPQLGSRAPLAIKEAEVAVRAAEQPQKDKVIGAHLVFVADRKVDTAIATAQSHFAVDERKTLAEQRDAMRLNSRTQEADSANHRADMATMDANAQRNAADMARGDAANAQNTAAELQTQIDALEAKVTDRGLVLTLGDVLFSSGTANLNSGGNSHLVKLADFLNKYPERSTVIEGHTDSIGSSGYNQGLSQRRADAVKSYLIAQSVAASRLTAVGKGEDSPVGDNASATGRQLNRRVEVIINNTQLSAR